MSQGIPPGQKILGIIQKLENVSLSWLVDGVGQPFLTRRAESDAEAARYLEALLVDEDWTVYLLTDRIRTALVLTQPAQIQHKDKRIPYRALEVITGPIGERTLEILNSREEILRKEISTDTMDRIWAGEMGSWKLLGSKQSPGVIDGAELARTPLREKTHLYGEENAVRDESASTDYELVAQYHRLTPHNRETLRMILQTLLEQQEQERNDAR